MAKVSYKTAVEARTAIIVAIITLIGGAAAAGIPAYYQYLKAHEEAEKLRLQATNLTSPAGRYHWELASEGWWGYIDVNNQGSANIQMWQYKRCPNGVQKLRLFEQPAKRNATLQLTKDPGKIHVELPVQQINYDDKCVRGDMDPIKTLSGDLDQTFAFQNLEIKYEGESGEAPTGGMILVKTSTPSR